MSYALAAQGPELRHKYKATGLDSNARLWFRGATKPRIDSLWIVLDPSEATTMRFWNRLLIAKHLCIAAIPFIVSCSDAGSQDLREQTQQEIQGGAPALITDFPSTVAIVRSSDKMVCSGTLIQPNVVLTAAHCLHLGVSISQMSVVYGVANIKSAPSSAKSGVAKAVEHPSFFQGRVPPLDQDGMGPMNDIALLILKKPIANAITAAVLPTSNIETELVPDKNVILAGFGYQDARASKDGILYSALSPIVKRTNNEMAVGHSGTPAPCRGDSGGPAYVSLKDTLYVAGLTSRGNGASSGQCPTQAIYTIPAGFESWVASVIQTYAIEP